MKRIVIEVEKKKVATELGIYVGGVCIYKEARAGGGVSQPFHDAIERAINFVEPKWIPLCLSNPPDLVKEYRFQKLRKNNWVDCDITNIEALAEVESGNTIRYMAKEEDIQLNQDIRSKIRTIIDQITEVAIESIDEVGMANYEDRIREAKSRVLNIAEDLWRQYAK